MKSIIICGFPGVGKSTIFKSGKYDAIDSDSSTFDKSEFPANYIKHIKENIGKHRFIFVSSHQAVREALDKAGLNFVVVVPGISRKSEFLLNYQERGNTSEFIKLLSNNWDLWLLNIMGGLYNTITLDKGEYLIDCIDQLEDEFGEEIENESAE